MNYFEKVNVYVYKLCSRKRKHVLTKDSKGVAIFHSWGVNYEELEMGVGSYTSAIVERLDGTIENVPCEQIKFIKEQRPVSRIRHSCIREFFRLKYIR